MMRDLIGVLIIAAVLLGIMLTPWPREPADERTFNLLVTDWRVSPPSVEVLDFDMSGTDCIDAMLKTFVGPNKLLSCEFDEGEWDE